MKIKKSLFSEFVKESALSGDHALREVKLDFGEKGLTMTSITEGNAILIKAQIPSSSFEDYASFGKIAILNYTELSKIISTLNEDITIQKEGNILILKGGRKVEIPLADETVIKDISKIPQLSYVNSFNVNDKFFTDINSNLSFSLNKSDSATVEFTGKNKLLTVKYGTKYKFEDTISSDGIIEEVEVKFGQALLNAVANLTGDIQVEIKTKYPITIIKKSDMYAIKIIVAPKI